MSVVPFTTQAGHRTVTQGSQYGYTMVLLYTDKMTERQVSVIKECQHYLDQHLRTMVCQISELGSVPSSLRYFVIPTPRDDIIKKIRKRFDRPMIYLPRVVIEAQTFRIKLPSRTLAVSLTMSKCQVFLVKSCAKEDIRHRINEMCGTVASNFKDVNLSVVVTDRADNKYCAKAFKRTIPVVSKDWVYDNYKTAIEEDDSFFNHDASRDLGEHQIKPFYGLFFKINIKDPGQEIKRIIIDNQGRIVYGNETCLTHIVGPPEDIENDSRNHTQSNGTQKHTTVDIDFLKTCVRLGHYIGRKEYKEYKLQTQTSIVIKQERRSPPLCQLEKNFTSSVLPPVSPANGYIQGRTAMLPPPPTPRSIRQNQRSSEKMDAWVNSALSSIDTAPTQRVSTQMRKLPEPELRIEQTIEPSQHLYWDDSSKKNF